MSDSSATPDQQPSRTESITEPASESGDDQRLLERRVPTLAASIRKVGFWVAIVLPVFALALLLNGLSTPLETLVFLGVLGSNLLALYVGHTHRR